MTEDKRLDEKALEQVSGGGISHDDLQAAEEFRGPFISANCIRCKKRNTDDCSYASGDPFDTLAMYYVFRNKPGCPWIDPK